MLQSSLFSRSMLQKPNAIVGNLEVRLVGVQGILEKVPDRNEQDPPPLPITKGKDGKKDKKRDLKKHSNEVCAVLRLDNQEVGNTGWRVANQQCWDARFSLELDRSRELEVAVYWRDYRAMSAVKFLRLEDFIDTQQVILGEIILFAIFGTFKGDAISSENGNYTLKTSVVPDGEYQNACFVCVLCDALKQKNPSKLNI